MRTVVVVVVALCLVGFALSRPASSSRSARAEKIVARNLAKLAGAAPGQIMAGAAMVDATMPVGVPLAGINHGKRRARLWPIPDIQKYTTWMNPSVGVIDPNFARALYINDGRGHAVTLVSIDAIGSNGQLMDMAYDRAVEMGFTLERDAVTLHASHTHSGPGAIASDFLWTIAPATDLVVPEIQELMVSKIAQAMVEAEDSAVPAVVGLGVDDLLGVTQNRRAGKGILTTGSIDPHMAVIRVDSTLGHPIATVFNFAIHGVCYGADSMSFSSDIMGGAARLIAESVGGVAMFINADAGDIDPVESTMCVPRSQSTPMLGSKLMAQKAISIRANITTFPTLALEYNSQIVPFGPTDLNYTLSRFNNCSSGGFLDICTFCAAVRCDANLHLPSSWIENAPRFTAVKFTTGDSKNWLLATLPGEPLLELGWQVRNISKDLGFDGMILAGYSNSHMGYFATPDQYDIGGYESQLTLWGIDTTALMANALETVASKIAPQGKN